jgi:membrane protease subunit (stomatin/prohibitin family)
MNIPVLTKLLSLPWGFTSPFRAEVYFVNLKTFPNLKWGTRDPVAFRDRELGLVRLRAHGIFNIKITQPVLFINSLVGTQGIYRVEDLEDYISQIIVSRLNDFMGEQVETLLDLPGIYDEFAHGLAARLKKDISHFGISLEELYINAITPPSEVQQAIDDRSRLRLLGSDLDKLVKLKTAMAVEKASTGNGSAQGGIGMGLGLMLPGLLAGKSGNLSVTGAETMASDGKKDNRQTCPECRLPVDDNARFCPHCGHQILVIRQCGVCGKNLSPKARFCPRCGAPAGSSPAPKVCGNCGATSLANAMFCNQCGSKL